MTTRTTPDADTEPGADRPIAVIVGARVTQLQGGYLRDDASAVAALARLRRGAGKPAGSVLDILEFTHAEEFARDWHRDEPSYAENAAHVAMTLFALHQQSQRRAVHVQGRPFGSAVRALDKDARSDGPVARRFAALGTADSFAELTHHLRGLVQLMRAANVQFDYGQLARDLWVWQLPGRAPQVQNRWGRDYHFPRTSRIDAEQKDAAQ
ncbi:type I-E CRISPR-associated protein Cse2/CasB [Actinophytocola xinjiangensis]|uniref:Type I-E CRISPR-associated protein Cse2/CasB n=1 Tax=Actinophytocola xinjiangensis TaxID=485602 RepID=A0A7Z1AY13_9PSEU|nr:type I-E CRISPR-associated protein Cse2/CasB [Actinophytocola xinjiangensis]OLF09061.1 type I-E CRISPR-associated protein Cse2/CasB [Actinophytocola xinjiangensis]